MFRVGYKWQALETCSEYDWDQRHSTGNFCVRPEPPLTRGEKLAKFQVWKMYNKIFLSSESRRWSFFHVHSVMLFFKKHRFAELSVPHHSHK